MQGLTGGLVCEKVAYGNKDGLIGVIEVPATLKKDEKAAENLTLEGEGPWSVSFCGAEMNDGNKWGTGYRNLVVRKFKENVAGIENGKPTISLPFYMANKDGKHPSVDLRFVPREGVAAFAPGDTVKIHVEWVSLPRVADDYYDPNEIFRKHLTDYPGTWETTYREAKGNNLKLDVEGGVVLENYPINIKA